MIERSGVCSEAAYYSIHGATVYGHVPSLFMFYSSSSCLGSLLASNVELKTFKASGSEEYSAAVLTGHVGVVVQDTLLRTL